MVDREVNVRLRAQVSQYMSGMQQASARTAAMGSQVQRTMAANQQALQAGGMAAVGFGAAVGAGLASAVSAGAEFEAQMNQVRAVSQANASEFERLSGIAREMGASTKFSATEAAGGLNFLSMAGFEAEESIAALPGVLDLAAAGNMELAQAADISSNVLQGFSMEAENISRVNDTMAATFTSANTNMRQLGDAMSYVAPVANSAGIELEETSAAIGLMSDAGIQGTRAGTGLRMALSRLLDETGPAADVLDRLGVSAMDSQGNLRDLDEIIRQLEESGANTSDVIQLFGMRAGPAMQTLVDRGADALEDFTEELEESGGTAQRVAETQMEGLQGAVTELGSAVEGLKIKIAESGGLTDSLEGLTDTTTGLVRAMEGLPDEVVGLTAQLAGGTAVVSTFGGAAALAASKLGGLGAVASAASKGLAGGVLFTGATKALGEMADSADSADTKLTDLIETSNSVAEAERRAQQEAENMGAELLNSIGPVEQWNRIWSGEFAGIIGMGGDLIETLKLLGHETEIAEGFAQRAADGFSAWAAESDPLGLTLGSTAANMEQTGDAADDAGDSAGRAAVQFDTFGDSIEGLPGIATDAFSALAGGVDVFSRYQQATQDAAEATDQSVDEMGASWGRFQSAQQQTLEDQRNWMANLRELRERGFDALADDLAARGPEQAGLVAEAVEQENAALEEGQQRMLAIREQNAQAALEQLQASGAQIINASGELSEEAAEAIAEELGVTPGNVREILVASDTVAEEQLKAVGETFGKGAEDAVRAMADKLNAGAEEVGGIVQRYASLVARGIQPVMEGIGASREAQALQRFVAGDRITGLAAGGITSEPRVLFGEGPGDEAFIPLYEGMGASRERSIGLWEETGRRLGIDPERTMASGGFTSTEDVPAVPGMADHGNMLGPSGSGAMDRTREEAVRWLEENLAPELGRGIGYQAMMEALRTEFPGLALISGPRPGSRTLSGNVSWHARNRAVDVPPEREVAEWIAENYGPQTLELITPWRDMDLHHGSPHHYSEAVHDQHSGDEAHVHWAMAQGGIIPTYDQGGLLPDGGVGANTSGQDEAVIPGDMSEGDVFHVPGMGHFLRLGGDWHQATGLGQLEGIEGLFGQAQSAKPKNIGPLEGSVEELFGGPGEIERAVENLREWELAQMDATDRLAEMRDQLDEMVPFTDEYMSQLDAIERLEGEIASNRQQRIDDLQRQADEAVDSLRDMLQERDRIEQRMADRRAQFAERVASLREQHTESVQQAEARRDESIAQAREKRSESVAEARERHEESVAQARERLHEQVTQAEERRDEQVAQARERREEQIADARSRHQERVADEIQRRAEDLRFDPLQRMDFTFGNRPGSIADNVRDQIEAVTRSEDLLSGLRGRGMDDAVIQALGLDDPRQLRTLEEFSRASEDEIARLNDAILDRNATASERAERDAERTFTSLGSTLVDMRSELDDEMAAIHADTTERIAQADQEMRASIAEADTAMRERMAEADTAMRESIAEADAQMRSALTAAREQFGEAITEADEKLKENLTERREQFNDDMAELKEELRAIGQDTGRTTVEAIAEGIESGLPALRRAAKEAEAQLDRLGDAKSGVSGRRSTLENMADRGVELTGSEKELLSPVGGGFQTFADGGMVPGTGPQRIVAHGGERIFSGADNDRLIRAIEGMGSGRSGPVQHVEEQHIYDAVDLQAWERSLVQASRIAR